jgi:hypothetical protein
MADYSGSIQELIQAIRNSVQEEKDAESLERFFVELHDKDTSGGYKHRGRRIVLSPSEEGQSGRTHLVSLIRKTAWITIAVSHGKTIMLSQTTRRILLVVRDGPSEDGSPETLPPFAGDETNIIYVPKHPRETVPGVNVEYISFQPVVSWRETKAREVVEALTSTGRLPRDLAKLTMECGLTSSNEPLSPRMGICKAKKKTGKCCAFTEFYSNWWINTHFKRPRLAGCENYCLVHRNRPSLRRDDKVAALCPTQTEDTDKIIAEMTRGT